jgi:hypothetical protein
MSDVGCVPSAMINFPATRPLDRCDDLSFDICKQSAVRVGPLTLS